jgi:2-keto-4-pentenoate hydratase/2-oxohepta-3-ene-1,7-dioic acid hydratase in catechol pathway
MRIARYDEDQLGVVVDGGIRDISTVVERRWQGTPYAMNDLITRWGEVEEAVADLAGRGPDAGLDEVTLLTPTPRPQHLLAAPLNYRRHVSEMVDSVHAPDALQGKHSAATLGFFLKAPGSISGPSDPIELPPLEGRSFHHEIELGVVIGRTARGLSSERALEHIFGYVCLLDITLRTEGERQEERVMRKSFETFTPTGPFIVTADEIQDVGNLDLHLEVNDQPRQAANTGDLIVGVEDLVAAASNVVTLAPGDLYATGTPEGVGPIVPGDVVTGSFEHVGELELEVVKRRW